MTQPTVTSHPLGNVEVQLARMEGKIDQALNDHDRRITEHAASIGSVTETQTLVGQMLATHTANIGTLKKDVTDLQERMSGSLQKVMSVLSPLLAVGSLILAYTIYVNGA